MFPRENTIDLEEHHSVNAFDSENTHNSDTYNSDTYNSGSTLDSKNTFDCKDRSHFRAVLWTKDK